MENWHLGFYICMSSHMILNAETKKFEKNRGADGLFGLAVKWAEMAAAHENTWNSKNFFLQVMATTWLVDSLLVNFCQTNYIAERRHDLKRPKKASFEPRTWFPSHGPVQAPRSKLFTLGRPPGWVLLIMQPNRHCPKNMGLEISGF